jgi:tetrapyrrole methylase family protein/MazG family protein/ATP diphosphatase
MQSGEPKQLQEELGDVLFALVNLARHLGVDAESALRMTTDKFIRRFDHVEKRAGDEHGGLHRADGTTLPLQTLDGYWEEAKSAERAGGQQP